MNSQPQKITKQFAAAMIKKALRGEPVGKGTGCSISFTFYDGMYNQYRFFKISNARFIPELNKSTNTQVSHEWHETQGYGHQRLINGSTGPTWSTFEGGLEYIQKKLQEMENTGRYNCTVTWHN